MNASKSHLTTIVNHIHRELRQKHYYLLCGQQGEDKMSTTKTSSTHTVNSAQKWTFQRMMHSKIRGLKKLPMAHGTSTASELHNEVKVWIRPRCCSRAKYGHPLMSSRRKAGVVDRAACLPSSGSGPWRSQSRQSAPLPKQCPFPSWWRRESWMAARGETGPGSPCSWSAPVARLAILRALGVSRAVLPKTWKSTKTQRQREKRKAKKRIS